MNTSRKGDRLALHVKQQAEERGLPVLKVRASGHMGDRGGIPADLVVCGIPLECKNYARGLSSGAIADILAEGKAQGVVHKCARGAVLITFDLGDAFDMLKRGELTEEPQTAERTERT